MLGSGDVNNPVSLATAALSSHTHKATSVPGAQCALCLAMALCFSGEKWQIKARRSFCL